MAAGIPHHLKNMSKIKINKDGVAALAVMFVALIGAFGGFFFALSEKEYVLAVCIALLAAMAAPFVLRMWNKIGAKKDDE